MPVIHRSVIMDNYHIRRFPELFRAMQPFLLAVNLNGMKHDGVRNGQKILPIGAGDQDLAMLKAIQNSGWHGPIGILDHIVETDSEETLAENLRGLDQLLEELEHEKKNSSDGR